MSERESDYLECRGVALAGPVVAGPELVPGQGVEGEAAGLLAEALEQLECAGCADNAEDADGPEEAQNLEIIIHI